MLTAVKVAFCLCIIGVFEETVSWTVDLPQVRKYFFEKRLDEREKYDRNLKDRSREPLRNNPTSQQGRVVYDNIDTHSLHTDYDKYRDNYADDYKYHGYMEQKVHDAVHNGSAYLEGLRRAIEDYTRRLESCRRLNLTVNIVQFNPNTLIDNQPPFVNLSPNNQTNILPPFPPNTTTITQISTNFTNFMSMSSNYTTFNTSDPLSNCMRADLASEHVRRLAQLAVWAASELQDKLYAERYDKHGHEHDDAHDRGRDGTRRHGDGDERGHGNDHDQDPRLDGMRRYGDGNMRGLGNDHDQDPRLDGMRRYGDGNMRGLGNDHDQDPRYDGMRRYGDGEARDANDRRQYGRYGHGDDHGHDDTLILRLAWFLDRLAHLTGYDPKPEDFVEQSTATPSTDAPPMLSMIPTLVSNEDLQAMMNCMNGTGPSVERCAFRNRTNATSNPNSFMNRGWPVPGSFSPETRDMRPSASDNQEYTYSEQVFTDDDMPLSLPQRPAKTKRKRSVQGDPLQNFAQYYAKYKTWTGANEEEKHSSEMSHVNSNKENVEPSNLFRTKRFIVKKKSKHHKEKPFPYITSIVTHKLKIKKEEKQVKTLKKFIEKLHKPKAEVKVFKFKKSKRSIKYSKKQQPRVPMDPQGDISYYIKNKPGRSYDYNPAQAALVRAGLEQTFQTGNLLVVRQYGANYNPANRMAILEGYIRGFSDV